LKSYFQSYTKARFDGVGGIDRRSLRHHAFWK